MMLSEAKKEGVNENLSAYKPPLNSHEAIDDFARSLTPPRRLKHVAELPQDDEKGKMTALRFVLLSYNSPRLPESKMESGRK